MRESITNRFCPAERSHNLGEVMKKLAKLVVIAVWAAGAFAVFAPWNVLSEGAVPYPEGFREWTHVKSQILGPESPIYKKYGGIHHTYANPKAVEGLRTGKYPDGSVFVFDQIELITKPGGVTAEGQRRFIDVMHKDDAKFAKTGGWGFEEFNADSSTERLLTPESSAKCYSCHASQKERGYVFSTFRK